MYIDHPKYYTHVPLYIHPLRSPPDSAATGRREDTPLLSFVLAHVPVCCTGLMRTCPTIMSCIGFAFGWCILAC